MKNHHHLGDVFWSFDTHRRSKYKCEAFNLESTSPSGQALTMAYLPFGKQQAQTKNWITNNIAPKKHRLHRSNWKGPPFFGSNPRSPVSEVVAISESVYSHERFISLKINFR